MKQIINTYNPELFKQEFSKTKTYQKIIDDHTIIYWDRYFSDPGPKLTPREIISQHTIAVMASFYFVNLVAENNDKPIYDIGCGGNYFKKYYPNIIGIDQPGNISADEVGTFNEEYAKQNINRFDNAIAICSLHFVPFTEMNKQFRLFVDTIKTNGIGLFTINTIHPFSIATEEIKREHNVFNIVDTTYYIDDNLDFSGLEILSYDIPERDVIVSNEGMTGDMRIVFKKLY